MTASCATCARCIREGQWWSCAWRMSGDVRMSEGDDPPADGCIHWLSRDVARARYRQRVARGYRLWKYGRKYGMR